MEFFFKKVSGCHSNKKGLHYNFFPMNFVKFFLFFYQCSDTEQYSDFFFQKSLENSCHRVLFQWSCRLWGTLRKDFIIVSFGWIFCEIFHISFFLKQTWANPSVTFRPLWDFTSVLKEGTEFLPISFDTCPCAAPQ